MVTFHRNRSCKVDNMSRLLGQNSLTSQGNKTPLENKNMNSRLQRNQPRQICEPAWLKQTISSEFFLLLSWEVFHNPYIISGLRGSVTSDIRFFPFSVWIIWTHNLSCASEALFFICSCYSASLLVLELGHCFCQLNVGYIVKCSECWDICKHCGTRTKTWTPIIQLISLLKTVHMIKAT